MTTSALSPTDYENYELKNNPFVGLSKPEKVIKGFETGEITLEKIKEGILKRVKDIKLTQLNNLSLEQIGLLLKANTTDKQVGERIKEVQKYINLKNKFKDSDKIFFRNDDGNEYIKTKENELFEILEIHEVSGEKLYITYNHLTQKYTIFSYDGEKLDKINSDLESVEHTKYENLYKIIEKKQKSFDIDSYHDRVRSVFQENGGYLYIGPKGRKYYKGITYGGASNGYEDIIFLKTLYGTIITNGKKEIEINENNVSYEEIILGNGKKLLLLKGDNCGHKEIKYYLINLDKLELLTSGNLYDENENKNLIIEKENNKVHFYTEEPRAFKLVQKILGSKGILKTIDFAKKDNQ